VIGCPERNGAVAPAGLLQQPVEQQRGNRTGLTPFPSREQDARVSPQATTLVLGSYDHGGKPLRYARGLMQYRVWLYRHVPARALAEKKRDYLSPEEIEAVLPRK
jgi:hypothetical protein